MINSSDFSKEEQKWLEYPCNYHPDFSRGTITVVCTGPKSDGNPRLRGAVYTHMLGKKADKAWENTSCGCFNATIRYTFMFLTVASVLVALYALIGRTGFGKWFKESAIEDKKEANFIDDVSWDSTTTVLVCLPLALVILQCLSKTLCCTSIANGIEKWQKKYDFGKVAKKEKKTAILKAQREFRTIEQELKDREERDKQEVLQFVSALHGASGQRPSTPTGSLGGRSVYSHSSSQAGAESLPSTISLPYHHHHYDAPRPQRAETANPLSQLTRQAFVGQPIPVDQPPAYSPSSLPPPSYDGVAGETAGSFSGYPTDFDLEAADTTATHDDAYGESGPT